MNDRNARSRARVKRQSGLVQRLLVVVVLLGVPLSVLVYQAHHTGLSVGQMFEHIF